MLVIEQQFIYDRRSYSASNEAENKNHYKKTYFYVMKYIILHIGNIDAIIIIIIIVQDSYYLILHLNNIY